MSQVTENYSNMKGFMVNPKNNPLNISKYIYRSLYRVDIGIESGKAKDIKMSLDQ